MSLKPDSTEVLRQTSRTFYLAIVSLPPRIKEAVMSSYLSLRAIDEIEDHATFDKLTKIKLLCQISCTLQERHEAWASQLSNVLRAHRDDLPEVTNRLDEWAQLAPNTIAPRIGYATSAMARRMAYWVGNDWRIHTKRDLDRYTFSVAGAVGVLLSDLWNWYDGTPSRKANAVGYGRGLQAVNILRNRIEDLARGVDFFPHGWTSDQFCSYARSNLSMGDAYVEGFPRGPARSFCRGPQILAYATLDALARGASKLTRSEVLELVGTEEDFRGADISGANIDRETQLPPQH
ncbi:MAG TPA: phytoene/squalene synthase family protein [Pyrinomonadaceae bacterium]|jgi:farnesyl-diphosphate farnesyltransferase